MIVGNIFKKKLLELEMKLLNEQVSKPKSKVILKKKKWCGSCGKYV